MIRPAFPGSRAPMQAGERVILRDRKGRRYLITLEDDGEWHSHAGFIRHEDLIGRPEGTAVRTSKNMEITALRPTREDITLKMPRGAQVVYPKDQALIVGFGDIRPGCTVIEAGAGSGALTLALLQAVGPTGRVISFERREDHLDVARENVTTSMGGEPDNWEVHHADVADGLPGTDGDRVVLDLLEPWDLIGIVGDALHPGGLLVVYTPTITQVMRLVESLDEDGRFGQTRTFETLLRTWNVDGLSVRPDHRMVAHTAFLTVTRRVLPPDDGGPVGRT